MRTEELKWRVRADCDRRAVEGDEDLSQIKQKKRFLLFCVYSRELSFLRRHTSLYFDFFTLLAYSYERMIKKYESFWFYCVLMIKLSSAI